VSVCLSHRAAAAGLQLWAWQAGDSDQLLRGAQRATAMRAVQRCQLT